MINPLTLKLSAFVDLEPEERDALDGLCSDARSHRGKTDLIREGDRPENVFLLIEGWAMRYKILPNGRRHIMAYLVPGDLCDVHVFILKEMDHNIGLLCDARVAAIPKEKMLGLLDEQPKLVRALWWSSLVDDSILREWLVNMGQRVAHDRIAHLLAELWFRLRAVGLVDGDSFRLPLTQADIGDTMGLTAVHVNRSIQRLRSEGLIELSGRELHIPNVQRLMDVSRFEPNYLHLERRAS